MMPVLTALLFIVPVVLLVGSAIVLACRSRSKGFSVKRTMAVNLLTFLVVMVVACGFTYTTSAKDVQPDVKATETTAMAAAETETEEADAPASANAASNESMGLGLLAAALVTGLAGIGGGIAVAAGAPAAIAAASEDPKSFGKSLIFVALGESIALYGVVISILILNKLV